MPASLTALDPAEGEVVLVKVDGVEIRIASEEVLSRLEPKVTRKTTGVGSINNFDPGIGLEHFFGPRALRLGEVQAADSMDVSDLPLATELFNRVLRLLGSHRRIIDSKPEITSGWIRDVIAHGSYRDTGVRGLLHQSHDRLSLSIGMMIIASDSVTTAFSIWLTCWARSPLPNDFSTVQPSVAAS